MSLDFLDDVLLLDFPFKTAQRAFQGFSILDVDFCQTKLTCLFTAALGAAPNYCRTCMRLQPKRSMQYTPQSLG
jgi:hypothetical protein